MQQFLRTPNLLSLSRVVLGISIPLWWGSGVSVVLVFIIWAGVSDGLDGWWARRFNARTPLGVVLDPLADKLFTIPFLFTAAVVYGGSILWALAIVNVLYDLDNTYQRRFEIKEAFLERYAKVNKPVTWWSKTKTAALFGFMVVVAIVPWYGAWLLFWPAAVSLVMVSYSWWLNRRRWVYNQIGLQQNST